jgi:pimeloyl-ACP methyl ester carboxylesterase
MIFTPTYNRKESLPEGCSFLAVYTEDGAELEGVISEPQNPTNTLLFFGGRNHDVVGIINKLRQTYPQSRIITFNYRSYGKSTGYLSEKNILNDGLKIVELVKKNYGEFYLLGYSLGSNIAAYIASKQSVKALFLIGAFDSIASLAKSKFVERSFFPDIDLSKIFRYKFTTGKYVQSVVDDTYLFVSQSDTLTYIQNARVLKERVKNLKEYHELQNLSHKEILWDSHVTDKINEVINA